MRYYWELVKHFFRANSRHGTHSPFVYRLAEQVIYAKAADSRDRVVFPSDFSAGYRQLLHDLLVAMDVGQLAKLTEQTDAAAVWINLKDTALEALLEQLALGKVLIVHEPYRSRSKWRALIAEPAVVVSIDLFHVGILMRRTAQRKENFELRYPYWRSR